MMKKTILLLSVALFSFLSCKKSGSDASSVRYEFSSDVSASYTMEYSSDVSAIQKETFQGTTWSKTVMVKSDPSFANISSARLVAYPPEAWANTANSAHVNLKIFVNGKEAASTDSLMTAFNLGGGILELYTF